MNSGSCTPPVDLSSGPHTELESSSSPAYSKTEKQKACDMKTSRYAERIPILISIFRFLYRCSYYDVDISIYSMHSHHSF